VTSKKINLAENQYQLDIGATWVFSIEWVKQLTTSGSTIVSAVWSLDAALDQVTAVIDGTKTKLKVKANGTARRGVFYRAQCEITTDDSPPLIDNQSIYIELIDQ
jgi:hypothetical protein